MSICRDCELWDRERAKDKAGRIRKDRAANRNGVVIQRLNGAFVETVFYY